MMDNKRRQFVGLFAVVFYLNVFTSRTVNAQQRPRILEHPADAIAARDEPLTLNCKATGRPQPDISWYHNGTPLVPSERRVILPEGSLFFLRVMHNKREQDAGIYWCEAKSSAGIAVSNNATLQIALLKDDFRSEPSDSIALVGGPVVMNCTPPRGIPEPSVLWYKDGKLLDLSGKRLSMVEGGSLMISEVQVSDAGKYECSAQSMAGRKNAPPATLKVLTPPYIVRGPTDTEVIESERVDIPCELVGDPKPIASWHRDGGSLPEGRSRVLLDNTLRIEDARAEDQGTYTCKGFNEGGNISLSIKLSVFATPRITEAPSDVDVLEGETVNLPCKASGRPKTITIWDKILSEGIVANLQDEISQMLEEEARQELLAKAKIMSFRAKRHSKMLLSNNRTRRSIVISDEEKDDDIDVNSLVTETTSFIDVSSSPPPELPNFEISKTGELVIKNIQKRDEGWYACTAINEAGSVVKKIFIHVKSPTDPEGDFQIPESFNSRWENTQNILITTVIPVSSSTLDVTWEYAQTNLFPSKGITLYYRPIYLNGAEVRILSKEYLSTGTSFEKKTHRLEDLKPYTNYEIFATVPKGLGGTISNLRKGKTLDGPPSAPPTDVRVGVINNTAAYVRWSPPPTHLINGELTGYKIQIKSNVTNKLLGQMSLNASTQSVVINSLSPGGRYIARVAPLTAGGLGPYSPPAPLHIDPSFIARPPKTDPALSAWSMSWMPGVALGILGICLISGAIFAVFWAKRNKRNLKASYPAPVLTSSLADKSHTLWMQNNTTIKPTHTYAVPPPPPSAPQSEYAELTTVNMPKLSIGQSAPPEPYATVTLQRGAGGGMGIGLSSIADDCRKCSASPSSSEYNAPIRMPMNMCDMLPPPPDHPYNSYKTMNNMTIRTNPAALSPQVMRRGMQGMPQPHQPPVWGSLPPPPIPNFPQNWMQERNTGGGYHHPQHQMQQQHPQHQQMQQQMQQQQMQQQQMQQQHQQHSQLPSQLQQQQQKAQQHQYRHQQDPHHQNIYSENEYESGSVLYEQFCRDNEASYFNEGGEPTEEYYRNVNMEFFEDQEFEPATPPPPCPPDAAASKGNPNLRLLAAANGARHGADNGQLNLPRRIYRNHHGGSGTPGDSSSCERNTNHNNGGGGPSQGGSNSSDDSESEGDRWAPRSRRSRSRSKSNERRFRGDQ
ncbi:roundabout homolog 3-like [Episyrphus balteatus]|uniref:roundabout homolog 3-like n=1 Tax=Episyrphus balteatus TaxID=286459 RepID=UPI002485D6A4|nr:roundabout homolog 3-like [Episyrphus balteatus]XP_055853854.1 roundabout homolog 3-like [Episyrphus balteatus]